ncbi:MAG: hypothetical protein KJ064_27275 [Anaerolineae bacterium]|nr:hypothetical protein [Anaerolineae bacterium]
MLETALRAALHDMQREQIRQLIASALNKTAYLARTFSLPFEVQDHRSTLQGQFSILMVDMYDIRSAKLSGFGDVSPGLANVLDPHVERLIVIIRALMDVLTAPIWHLVVTIYYLSFH